MSRRAVITGMGVVSPLGIGKEENWQHLLAGTSGISRISRLNVEHLPVKLGAEVKNFNPKQFISDRKALRLSFLNVHLGLAAAKLAVDDAALPLDKIDPTRFGAVIGSGGGGFDDGPGYEDLNEPILRSWDEEEKTFDSAKFGEKGVPVAHPLFLLKALPNNAFYYISLLYNIQGENNNIISSYTGGSQAIGDAFRSIRRGDADLMIAGGYDCLLTPNTLFSLHAMNLLSGQEDPATACRPFDFMRDGMVAGEGAGFVLVEELSHAQNRGAQIYAEIVGYGNASSAYHIYQPAPGGDGMSRAILRALADAQLDAAAVGWVSADGIATQESDRAEVCALKTVFGDRLSQLPVSATKSMTGHLGSASGAIESVYAVLALCQGLLPPTINYEHPDPDCALDLVLHQPREKQIAAALSINQGIGGQCTALMFKKYA
jgi:3-oxoacyl-[acyl-carrier-protein] synthase II